jgi:hypothetical protein
MSTDPEISYAVVARPAPDGQTEVSLVRERVGPHHHFHVSVHTEEGTLFSQRFPPHRIDEISTRQGELEQVGHALLSGRLGAWVRRTAVGGDLDLELYRQTFDGAQLSTELIRQEKVTATDDDAVERAATLLAELTDAATKINDELAASLDEMLAQEGARREKELEAARQARELGSILDDVPPAV